MVTVGGWLVLVGSVVFFVGAAYGVPRVFTVRAREERLALLRTQADAWRKAQWLYAAGPLLAASGVVVVGGAWSGWARLLAGGAGIAMLVGALLWSVSCARRARRIEEFSRGELPAAPWLGYVWLTLAGLVLLGVASLGFATWVGVLLLTSAAAFAAMFVIMRDIPPFVFYVVLASEPTGQPEEAPDLSGAFRLVSSTPRTWTQEWREVFASRHFVLFALARGTFVRERGVEALCYLA